MQLLTTDGSKPSLPLYELTHNCLLGLSVSVNDMKEAETDPLLSTLYDGHSSGWLGFLKELIKY